MFFFFLVFFGGTGARALLVSSSPTAQTLTLLARSLALARPPPALPRPRSPAWFALVGAFVLCIASDRLEVEEIMHLVEWDMLIFFAALFVMVEGAVEVGLINRIGNFLAALIRAAPPDARRIVAIEILLWVSAIISGEYTQGRERGQRATIDLGGEGGDETRRWAPFHDGDAHRRPRRPRPPGHAGQPTLRRPQNLQSDAPSLLSKKNISINTLPAQRYSTTSPSRCA